MLLKYIKKYIAVILVLVFLAEMLPTLAVATDTLSIPEITEISAAIAPSTVEAVIPSTFTVDASTSGDDPHYITPDFLIPEGSILPQELDNFSFSKKNYLGAPNSNEI
jgi:hypothetical protein